MDTQFWSYVCRVIFGLILFAAWYSSAWKAYSESMAYVRGNRYDKDIAAETLDIDRKFIRRTTLTLVCVFAGTFLFEFYSIAGIVYAVAGCAAFLVSVFWEHIVPVRHKTKHV